jgi:hypothetical protein
VNREGTSIDLVLPAFTVRERHSRHAAAPGEALMRACREVTWAELPLMRLLTFGRFANVKLRPSRPVLSDFTTIGPYCVLADSPEEIVVGMVMYWPYAGGAVETLRTPASFAATATPGDVRVALGFRSISDASSPRPTSSSSVPGRPGSPPRPPSPPAATERG